MTLPKRRVRLSHSTKWPRATAPDLVTSTVHNPRTLAATSDPDTHDPTAATPAGGP